MTSRINTAHLVREPDREFPNTYQGKIFKEQGIFHAKCFALLIRSLHRQKQAAAAGREKEHGGFGCPCEKWARGLARSAYSFFGSDACNAALAFSSVSSPCIVRRSVSSAEVSSKF